MTIRPLFQIHFSMRNKLLFLLPLAMLLVASCNKEIPGEAGKDLSLAEEEVTTSLRIITGKTGTKAYNATDYPLNDGIERLDIYTFRQSGENSGERIHYTVTPDPSGVTVYDLKDKKNSDIGALVFANLDEDTATLFEDGESYSLEFEKTMHKAIKKITIEIEEMKFNTCISTFMTMVKSSSVPGTLPRTPCRWPQPSNWITRKTRPLICP